MKPFEFWSIILVIIVGVFIALGIGYDAGKIDGFYSQRLNQMQMDTMMSKFGYGDTVVFILQGHRIFGRIEAIKLERGGNRYDLQVDQIRLYDISEGVLEIPSAHQDITEIR